MTKFIATECPCIGEMRERLGLKEDDTSRDKAIEAMEPESRLRLLAGWHLGDPSWAGRFIRWARTCGYEVKP